MFQGVKWTELAQNWVQGCTFL